MNIKPLKGFGAFDAVLRRGRRFTAGPVGLTIETSPEASKTSAPLYVGVTIGKRTAKAAVVRTRVRRLLREAVRQVIEKYDQELRAHHVITLIIVWRSSVSHPFRIGLQDVQPRVEDAVMKALSSFGEQSGQTL